MKRILITGSSRGIGKGISDLLHSLNYKVIDTHYLNWRPNSLNLDLSNPQSIKDTMRDINEWYGGVDILINNGGISQRKDFLDLTLTDLDMMWKTNIRGAMLLTQIVLPKMIKQNYGKIINISSVGGISGGIEQVHYASTKAAMINFTKSLARIYAKDGIRCNCISPGIIDTDMNSGLTNLNNCGKVEDVVNLVEFLISEKSNHINGQNIVINGGNNV